MKWSIKIYICWLFHLSFNEMSLLPCLFLEKQSSRAKGQSRFDVSASALISLRMSNTLIQNKDGLYYRGYIFNSFLEWYGEGTEAQLHFTQAFRLNKQVPWLNFV